MPLWLIILLIAVAVIVLFLIFTYNGLVRLRNMVDEAWNQISVQLKRRHDLIPNLVNAVKAHDFEQETLTKVMRPDPPPSAPAGRTATRQAGQAVTPDGPAPAVSHWSRTTGPEGEPELPRAPGSDDTGTNRIPRQH